MRNFRKKLPIILAALFLTLATGGTVFTQEDFTGLPLENGAGNPESPVLQTIEVPDPVTGEMIETPYVEFDPSVFQPPLPDEPPPGMAIVIDPVTGERKLAYIVQSRTPDPGPGPVIELGDIE